MAEEKVFIGFYCRYKREYRQRHLEESRVGRENKLNRFTSIYQ